MREAGDCRQPEAPIRSGKVAIGDSSGLLGTGFSDLSFQTEFCFRASTYFLLILLQLSQAEAYNFSSDIRFTMTDSELAQTEPLKCHRLLLLLLGQKQMLFYSISAIVIAIFYHQRTDCLKSQCRISQVWRC